MSYENPCTFVPVRSGYLDGCPTLPDYLIRQFSDGFRGDRDSWRIRKAMAKCLAEIRRRRELAERDQSRELAIDDDSSDWD